MSILSISRGTELDFHKRCSVRLLYHRLTTTDDTLLYKLCYRYNHCCYIMYLFNMSELQSQAPPILPREAGAIGSGKRSGLVELLLKYSSFLQLYTHSQYLYLAESCSVSYIQKPSGG